MSHNIHIIVLSADDAEDAAQRAYTATEGWGSADNYKQVQVAFSQAGERMEFHSPWPGQPDEDFSNLNENELTEGLRSRIAEVLAGESFYLTRAPTTPVQNIFEKGSLELDWWSCNCLAKYFQALSDAKYLMVDGPVDFNLFEHEFRPWQLDEFGVTHLDGGAWSAAWRDWAVVIDVHS